MKYRMLFVLLLGVSAVGCGGSSGGLAPSRENTNPPLIIDMSGENNFKYGETQTSANSWEVTLDTTDPVENVTLLSGWSIEVKYE